MILIAIVMQVSQADVSRSMQQMLNTTGRGYEGMQRVEADRQRRLANQQALAAQQAAAADRQRGAELKTTVGQLAAKGDCDGAKKAALAGGDFDLAERVAKICP